MRLSLLLSIILVGLIGLTSANTPLHSQFLDYAQSFNKHYKTQEEADEALVNFKASLERIALLSEAEPEGGAVYGINRFSDWSPAQFKRIRGSIIPKRQGNRNVVFPKESTMPASVDWRLNGTITGVKDQKRCGSCWAFSAIEELESMWILHGKGTLNDTILSPQQLVDCDKEDSGCGGGDTITAYTYLREAGAEKEQDYPYKAHHELWCHYDESKVVAKMTGYEYATLAFDEVMLAKNLAQQGPISICVNAEPWQDYKSGIFKGKCPGTSEDLDHCVQLVGYGGHGIGEKFWLVRNSWAEDWGENGYIRVERDAFNKCGIATEATIVHV